MSPLTMTTGTMARRTASCAWSLTAGDRVVVIHAGPDHVPGDPVWPDQEERDWSDWAHWSRWAAARDLDVVGLDVFADGCPVAALTHLLWVDPSVRAVLVAGEAAAAGACVEEIREAMALTGSSALLLVDSIGSTVRSG
jgi:hypothetical protein